MLCTVLHFITIYYSLFHYTVLHFTTNMSHKKGCYSINTLEIENKNTNHFSLYFHVVPCRALHSNAPYCIVFHYNALYCVYFYYPVLLYIVLLGYTLYYSVQGTAP